MAEKYGQSHCEYCNRPTLHVRDSYVMPHGGHAAATLLLFLLGLLFWPALFLAGLWVCLWFFHTLMNFSFKSRYRCTLCGSQVMLRNR